jgi:23S rRNA (uracil1939-C5)-methyltransferase
LGAADESTIATGPLARRRPVASIAFDGTLPPGFFAGAERAVLTGVLGGLRVEWPDSKRPLVIGTPDPFLATALGPLRLGADGFAQASEAMNEVLVARVQHWATQYVRSRADRVVELFAGAGNFTVHLQSLTDRLVAVESNGSSVEALRANVRRLAPPGYTPKVKAVEANASTFELPADTALVVLDPPRTGAKSVMEHVAQRRVRRVIYVACDPPTLGRDLAVLQQAGYGIDAVELFELFPHTSHVETLVALRRSTGPTAPSERRSTS